MKTNDLIFSLIVSIVVFSASADTPPLMGPYLGQKPPGTTPVAFAPGIITTDRFEYGAVFAPGMKELYLIREKGDRQQFVLFENKQNQWHERVLSRRVGQPFIAPDGQTLHLGKRYKTRQAQGWSEIKPLAEEFQNIRIMRLTASAKGTYVFDEVGTDGDGVLRYSSLKQGKRQAPQALSEKVNSGTWNAHPFIAPDESYILWDGRREKGQGNSDIYISYLQPDGTWGDAINLGDKINTQAWEAGATVTPDGKYLFFNRMSSPDNVDIYWVDASIIEHMRSR